MCLDVLETNGGAPEWTDWKDIPCSRACVGIQKRTRHCNEPPPIGLNRTCEGGVSQVRQCNHYPKNCSLDTKEIPNSVSLKFPDLDILRVSHFKAFYIKCPGASMASLPKDNML